MPSSELPSVLALAARLQDSVFWLLSCRECFESDFTGIVSAIKLVSHCNPFMLKKSRDLLGGFLLKSNIIMRNPA